MTGSDIALIITAAGTVITAVGIAVNNHQTKKVHELVNSQHDILLAYQTTLITALKAGGIEVPTPGADPKAP